MATGAFHRPSNVAEPAPTPTRAAVDIDLLAASDVAGLIQLTAAARLPTLRDPDRVARLCEAGQVFGARMGGRLVGCTCFDLDVPKQYRAGLDLVAFPQRNVYLCGTYVQPDRRRAGVGSALLTRRLEHARTLDRAVLIVELLGTGVAGSVDSLAEHSLRFYLANGFTHLGTSVDPDAGLVLGFAVGA